MRALLLQVAGLAGGVTFAFFIGWAVGGLAACVALVYVGLAVEGS